MPLSTVTVAVKQEVSGSPLIAARNRGIDVSLMVDAVGTMQTPDALFERLRQAGVQVAVFNPVNPVAARAGWSHNQRNHRKVLVVDSVWSTVGSSNMDWRSFALNYEINAVVLGPEFGGEMEAQFQRDVADSVRITPEAWKARGVGDRYMEFQSRLFERWL